jgi:hypothetical protein
MGNPKKYLTTMELRNHGLDTLKIYFSESRKDPDGSNSYSPDELEALRRTLLRKSSGKIIERLDRFYKVISFEFFIGSHIKVYTNTYCSILEFSAPSLVHGHNINGLSLAEIDTVMKVIENITELDPSKAVVRRIDYCFNFSSHMMVALMHDFISTSYKRFRRSTEEDTLYFRNKTREVCMYSQVNKFSGTPYQEHIKAIQQELNAPELLRVELRLKGDLLRDQHITLPDLGSTSVTTFLGKQFIDLLNKITFNNPDCTPNAYSIQFTENMTSSDFFFECLKSHISNIGFYPLMSQALQRRSKFAYYYHFKKVVDQLTRAMQSLSDHTNGCEKIDAIPYHIMLLLLEIDWMGNIQPEFPDQSTQLQDLSAKAT